MVHNYRPITKMLVVFNVAVALHRLWLVCFRHFSFVVDVCIDQGSQTHLGVRATLQDITQSGGRIVFKDDKMQ